MIIYFYISIVIYLGFCIFLDEVRASKYKKLYLVEEKRKMKCTNLNETLSKEELAKLWAETVYMADRPRTWKEWFCWTFYGRFRIFRRTK